MNKRIIKKILGQLPYTAELYWQLVQKHRPGRNISIWTIWKPYCLTPWTRRKHPPWLPDGQAGLPVLHPALLDRVYNSDGIGPGREGT